MKTAIKILRVLLIVILIMAIGVPVTFYILLSTDWAQQRLCRAGEEILGQVLGTEVQIGGVTYAPFNRIAVKNVRAVDDNGNGTLWVNELEARVEFLDLIAYQKLIIDYVVLDGLTLSLSRESDDAPLNIQNIINHLSSKESEPKETHFDLRLNDFEILNGKVSYDVLDSQPTPGRLNPRHLLFTDLRCDIYAPKISDQSYQLEVNHLSVREQSGLMLSNLVLHAAVAPDEAKITLLQIEMPNSTLIVSPMAIEGNWKEMMPQLGRTLPLEFGLEPGTHVYLPDLAPVTPKLKDIRQLIDISLEASGVIDSIEVKHLLISAEAGQFTARMHGLFTDCDSLEKMNIVDCNLDLASTNGYVHSLLETLGVNVSKQLDQALTVCTNLEVEAQYQGTLSAGSGNVKVMSDAGTVYADGTFAKSGKNYDMDVETQLEDLDLGALLGNSQLGLCTAQAQAVGSFGKGHQGDVSVHVDNCQMRGYDYRDINLKLNADDGTYVVNFASEDPNAKISLYSHINKEADKSMSLDMVCRLYAVNLDTLNLYKKHPGYNLSGNIQVQAQGRSLAQFAGDVRATNLHYVDNKGQGLSISKIDIDANNRGGMGEINIDSDFMRGSLQGNYNLANVGKSVMLLMDEVFPSFASNAGMHDMQEHRGTPEGNNDFTFDFTVADAEHLCEFFNLPVLILDPVNISGHLSDSTHKARVNVDAPYLIQGSNLVENTYVSLSLDGISEQCNIYATTHYPTKKGPMDMIASINAEHDRLATNVDWQIVRDNPINGNIRFDTQIYKDADRQLSVEVDIKPGLINFGNEVWNILPSQIFYRDKYLKVYNFSLQAPSQTIVVNGTASQYPQDQLIVNLKGIQLIDIFETLDIDKALICGNATGTLRVTELFTKSPNIESTDFFVKDMGYNGCVLGDGNIKITYDVDKAAFCFDAVLDQTDGRQSKIKGSIVPAEEYLDFDFDADHVKVGFLKPFMDAFCSDIEGYASGRAHLYGTFKYIDLAGDIMADTVRLKIDFTNTWYSASDSLRIRPGVIDLDNITIYDENGQSAKLNGWVKHYYFHQPSFDFAITGARNFLSYNITKADNPRWYGTIYGNGSAHVTGEPGVVNIGVAMSTAPKSTFTFELLDDEEAAEYSFIVFNDVTPVIIGDAYTDVKIESKAVEKAKSLQRLEEEDEPTDYRMDIKVDITPQAQVNIVMDPIGGDCIHAYGAGQMAMTYDSTDEDLRLMGTYTLERGDYNFTLQDILIKNFTIRQGSSITFTGDPYAAQLDINAIYSVNANLSDLDESFLQDKDLNRTNVPVYAVMKVTGNMLQPDIAFDLEFPTLTQDVYRKVRSIVSTDDMMNRQIIYLLALNRFYTPEYMASTTKGNEIFSVASATISSQLSSMLGKLSDNWSIAPNLRSDRGDFSDIEVDLTLSSSLLNNRLLFNGNFGYRDKSLNQNQFIGDFDIEYLLNRSGNLRLKAYNRYNDQNYYLRTAQTTQGVGVVWHRDFDNLFGFLRRKKGK